MSDERKAAAQCRQRMCRTQPDSPSLRPGGPCQWHASKVAPSGLPLLHMATAALVCVPISLVIDHPFSLERDDSLLAWAYYDLNSTPYDLAAVPRGVFTVA